jgi:hypothetical protein
VNRLGVHNARSPFRNFLICAGTGNEHGASIFDVHAGARGKDNFDIGHFENGFHLGFSSYFHVAHYSSHKPKVNAKNKEKREIFPFKIKELQRF